MSFVVLTDTPGIIMDITSDQRESTMGGCTVNYAWSAPSNTDLGDISHFMVLFNGSSYRIAKSESSVCIMVQPVCTCASHIIAIFAVDSCGRNGQSRNHVVTKISNATCQDTTIDQPKTKTDSRSMDPSSTDAISDISNGKR